MPAFNQLAIYYLELAKKKAGRERARTKKGRRLVVSGADRADVNQQMLDLAALVTSQAIRKNPKYAPIHNTAGLIQVEQKNFNCAEKSFGQASALDANFFEAHMNYGAANLSFRGFAEAEKAYRAALRLQPKEFEAHLGLALALRGQINDSNWDKQIAESEKHLLEARKIAPDRPETYYNEAILTQEFKAKGSQEKAISALEKAAQIYKDFIAKAGSDPAYAQAVKRSKERAQDIVDTVKFIKEGEEIRKAEAAAQAAAKAAPPAPPPAADTPPKGAPPKDAPAK
jgi:tetratricopeptide (TPR) repeat protein